jgi:DNA-binding transcriptional LysR family regulator
VSRLVAALERRVGGALFERTSRRVRLTPLGQQLVGELPPVYAQPHTITPGSRPWSRPPGQCGRKRAGTGLPGADRLADDPDRCAFRC